VKEADMETLEIRVSGLGGQGIILAGYIMGKAASIYDGKQATMSQAYGPEARGSACSSQVIISDSRIHFPYVTEPEVLVCMSQEAHDKFADELRPGGTLLIDETLVKTDGPKDDADEYTIPATQIAEDLGRRIVANIVMLGFFAAVTRITSRDSMREAVATCVPKAAIDLNLEAFDKGYEYGASQVGNA
jgi:2-oxoglutarate ferredoxin oxidoreductase subunit gamma